MSDLFVVIPLAIALCSILLWVLRPQREPREVARPSPEWLRNNANLPARHYKYFPQIQRALSSEDTRYLLEVAPPLIAKRVLRERRVVARHFLQGLHEDFSNLARLGRVIASLSPVVSREQEMERFFLILKFQALYALVWLQITSGILPLQRLELLTRLVGRLASRMEEAVSEINAVSARQLPGDLSA
jgi:hypothetical protein